MDAVTILATFLFAFSGNIDVDSCELVDQNACSSAPGCALFTVADAPTCKLSCDARTSADSCNQDSTCQWSNQGCELTEAIVGC